MPTFRRNILYPSSGKKTVKRWLQPKIQHDTETQKIIIIIIIVIIILPFVKTSLLALIKTVVKLEFSVLVNNSAFGGTSSPVPLGKSRFAAKKCVYCFLNVYIMCPEFINTKFRTSNFASFSHVMQFMPSHWALLSLFCVAQVKS
jgi:hypothetical protein